MDVVRPSFDVFDSTGNSRAASPCFKYSGNFSALIDAPQFFQMPSAKGTGRSAISQPLDGRSQSLCVSEVTNVSVLNGKSGLPSASLPKILTTRVHLRNEIVWPRIHVRRVTCKLHKGVFEAYSLTNALDDVGLPVLTSLTRDDRPPCTPDASNV